MKEKIKGMCSLSSVLCFPSYSENKFFSSEGGAGAHLTLDYFRIRLIKGTGRCCLKGKTSGSLLDDGLEEDSCERDIRDKSP